MSAFDNLSSSVTMVVYVIKDTNPPVYQIYDVDNIPEARRRLEIKHPEYKFLGIDTMTGRTDAQEFSRAFNKGMLAYHKILAAFPNI